MSSFVRWVPAGPRLSPRDRRALLLGGVVTALTVGAGRGWPAYQTWASALHLEAEVATRDAALVRAAANAGVALRDTARTRGARLRRAELRVVPAASPSAAAAELGSILRDIADDAGMTMGPIAVDVDTVAPSGAGAGAGAAYVRVRATGDATGLFGTATDMLGELEAGPYALRVREFTADPAAVASPWGAGAALTAGPASADVGTRLRVHLVVEGLARVRAVGPASPAGDPARRAEPITPASRGDS